jgi:hypothetical protein
MSVPMIYSMIVMTLIITGASVMMRQSFQRMYTGNDNRFEYYVTEMAFSGAYMFLVVLPCSSMMEYRKVISFINNWGYLQVPTSSTLVFSDGSSQSK